MSVGLAGPCVLYWRLRTRRSLRVAGREDPALMGGGVGSGGRGGSFCVAARTGTGEAEGELWGDPDGLVSLLGLSMLNSGTIKWNDTDSLASEPVEDSLDRL